MNKNIIKYPICLLKGHLLDTPSIIRTLCSDNYLKKCSRCGLYVAHASSGLSVCMSERRAMKFKRDVEKEFPYDDFCSYGKKVQ